MRETEIEREEGRETETERLRETESARERIAFLTMYNPPASKDCDICP